jgi:hypothetical protein
MANSQLLSTQAELSAREARLSAAGAQLSDTHNELVNAQAKLGKRDEILLWIETSRAWRLSSQVRRLFDSRGAQWMRRGFHSSRRSGLHSSLDFPNENAEVESPLRIEGWAFSKAPITRVEAFLDDFYLGSLHYGLERRDVVDAYPVLEQACCGFSDLIELRPSLVGKRKLAVRVYDEDGNLQLYRRSLTIQPNQISTTSLLIPQKTDIEFISHKAEAEDSNGTQAMAAAIEVDPLISEFRELLDGFKSRIRRDPSILELGVNVNLSSTFPELAIFSPVSRNSHKGLPYLESKYRCCFSFVE